MNEHHIPNVPNRPDWDEFFMRHVYLVDTKSKDTNTHIGAVLVRNRRIFSEGYNGIPSGVRDDIPERYLRPEKYFWFEHAERNAIYTCAYEGISTKNSICYTTIMPCADCARALCQSGIIEIVLHKQCQDILSKLDHEKWLSSGSRSAIMFQEKKVLVRYFDMKLNVKCWLDGNDFVV
jgi:dCMP deaminase